MVYETGINNSVKTKLERALRGDFRGWKLNYKLENGLEHWCFGDGGIEYDAHRFRDRIRIGGPYDRRASA